MNPMGLQKMTFKWDLSKFQIKGLNPRTEKKSSQYNANAAN